MQLNKSVFNLDFKNVKRRRFKNNIFLPVSDVPLKNWILDLTEDAEEGCVSPEGLSTGLFVGGKNPLHWRPCHIRDLTPLE